MMEDRNWVYELRPGALEGHKFADANAASTAADALSPRKPQPVFKLASPRKGSALSPSKRAANAANAKLLGKGYKVQSKLQLGTPSQSQSQGQDKENAGVASWQTQSPKKGLKKGLKSPKKGTVGLGGLGGKTAGGLGGKTAGGLAGKHNPKRIGISERAIMKGRPIMRDIMNEITDGRF